MPSAIDRIIRQALWEAHHKQCAYCGSPVRFKELQIDHIIPRASFQDSQFQSKVLETFGLAKDFDFDGTRNKLPTCSKCNRDKSDRLAKPVRTTHFLELALSKSASVEDHAVRIQKTHSEDALHAALFVGLAQGIVSREQIQNWVHGADTEGLRFFLTNQLNLSDTVRIDSIRREDVLEYYDVPLHFDYWSETTTLHNDADETVEVNTLRQYEEATKNGFYALSNADMKFCAASFDTPIQILKAVESAQVPEISFIADPKIRVCDIDQISSSVFEGLLSLSHDFPDVSLAKNGTIKKLIEDGIVKIEDVGQNHLCVESEYMGCRIEEVFRADLNDDGIEEILVSYWAYAVGGSMGGGATMVLKRPSEDELLSEDKDAGDNLKAYYHE